MRAARAASASSSSPGVVVSSAKGSTLLHPLPLPPPLPPPPADRVAREGDTRHADVLGAAASWWEGGWWPRADARELLLPITASAHRWWARNCQRHDTRPPHVVPGTGGWQHRFTAASSRRRTRQSDTTSAGDTATEWRHARPQAESDVGWAETRRRSVPARPPARPRASCCCCCCCCGGGGGGGGCECNTAVPWGTNENTCSCHGAWAQ